MKKTAQSDLFCENFGAPRPARGAGETRRAVGGFEVADGTDGRGARYCSIFVEEPGPSVLDAFSDAVLRCAGEFAERVCGSPPGRVLIAGLGNGGVPSDSFGSALCSRIDVGMRGGVYVCAVEAGVPAMTGVDTADHVGAVARAVGAELVVAADSLAAISPERLCRVLQITDAGISPGSGVSSHKSRISPETAGCPVISLGIPTAVRGRLVRGGGAAEGLFTAVGVGADVAFFAEAAGRALNSLFFGE